MLYCYVMLLHWTQILHYNSSSILTPFGLSKLIAYFTPDQTKITKNQAYQYAGIVVFLKLGAFLVMSNLRLCETMMGMKIHASLKSLLYRKALKLSSSASSETNLGNLITLITKDVNTIEMNLWLFKDVTTFFIQFFTLAYLLYDKMGTPAFIGLTMIFIPVPIQGKRNFVKSLCKVWPTTSANRPQKRYKIVYI